MTPPKSLPEPLSREAYLAISQLPLTYPWSTLIFDFKDVLPSFDRNILACLITGNISGISTPHPSVVLFSFLN